jgi:regulator of protease activity HflC (stomatin/prohibitin superfamily)
MSIPLNLIVFFAALVVVFICYAWGAVKILPPGQEAIVERLGQYHRKLTRGINFIVPLLDTIVFKDTIREQILDIRPQQAITKDNIAVEVDAVVFWRILELEKAYYTIEKVEVALEKLLLRTLRSTIGELELEQTYSSRADMNQNLLQQLDEVATSWGVNVLRVEVLEITPPRQVLDALARVRAAESDKQAEIFRAEGQKQAMMTKIEIAVEAIKLLSEAIDSHPNAREVLQFLRQTHF